MSAGTSSVPPPEYWTALARELPGPQLESLRDQSDRRLTEFTAGDLPPPEAGARALLERFAADGWVRRELRHRCPSCSFSLDEDQATGVVCPDCGQPFAERGGVSEETVFVRTLPWSRSVEWVVAVHGMNTSGSWQEEFSWHLATTWGRSVPVAVYKYGIIIADVVMAWRRRKLQRALRGKIAALRDQARAQGYAGKPDLIAHSFGTWLFGHLLRDELGRDEEERLRFGRVVLAGCVLRPDFDWKRYQDAGLVEDVLNHYGTADAVVPLAHATIWDSGPAGRRGFEPGREGRGFQVLNIRAEGYGHSDLFAVDKCVVDGEPHRPCTGAAGATRHLEHSYRRYWKPFLTLPPSELARLPDRLDPTTGWRPLPWPLRGTLFPFFALPLVAALTVLLVAGVGGGVRPLWAVVARIAGIAAAGLLALFAGVGVIELWRSVIGRWRRR